MRKLDKSKGYGAVTGSTDGVCFEQDGMQFDAQGLQMGGAPEKKDAKAKVADNDAAKQLAAQVA